jgi:hypothetical protein
MNKVKAYVFIITSIILFIICGAAVVALVISFTARDNLAAVESVFGTGVLVLCLLLLAVKSLKAGKTLFQDGESVEE